MPIEDHYSWPQIKRSLEGALNSFEAEMFVKFWARQHDGIAYEYAGIVRVLCKDEWPRYAHSWDDMFWSLVFMEYARNELAWHSADELRVWYDLHVSLSENEL